MRIERTGDEAVLVVDGGGPAVTVANLIAVMGEAFEGGASVIAVAELLARLGTVSARP